MKGAKMDSKLDSKLTEFEVVGLHYRLTEETMRKMQSDLPLICHLEREPTNVFDENAIKVVIVENENFHLGYLPRQVASVFAPVLDAGEQLPFAPDMLLTEINPETGRGTLLMQKRSRKK